MSPLHRTLRQAARPGRAEADRGMTLVELLISMILLSVVSLLVTGAAVNALRTTSDSESLVTKSAEAQTAMDRLSRNLRAAVNPILDPSASPVSYTQGFVTTGPFSAMYYTNVKNLTGSPSVIAPLKVLDQVVADPQHAGGYALTETTWQPLTSATGTAPLYTWPGAGITTTLAYGLAPPGGSTPPLFGYLRPTYFRAGAAADLATGVANCAAATAPTPTTAATGDTVTDWVGAQQNITVSRAVGSVQLTLTLTSNGTNSPSYSAKTKTVTTTTTVALDAANNYQSRLGTCE